MDSLSGLQTLVTRDVWPALQERGQMVLDLVRSRPLVALGAATGTVLLWKLIKAPRNLPPGPMGYPVMGALSYADKMEEKLLAAKPKYGEVISMYMMGQLYVILNSERVIREAFVKRSDVFSHRHRDLTTKIMNVQDEIFNAPYDETWKKNKKFAVSTLKNFGFGSPKGEEKLQEQLDYLQEILIKTKGSPIDFTEPLKLQSAALVSKMILGSCKNLDDPDAAKLVEFSNDFFKAASDLYYKTMTWAMVGEWLVQVMCKKDLNKMAGSFEALLQFLIGKIEAHKVGLSEREAEDVMDAFMKERSHDEKTIRGLASTILAFLPDAIDTTTTLNTWLLFNVVHYPGVQKRLQEEVDAVCGPGRNPSISDRKAMSYTQAVIYETLRHSNLIIMSMMREIKEDVQFEGYNIPKGSLVIANVHAAHFDPDIFPNPKQFDPSRFLDDDGNFKNSMASSVVTFLVGPRMCMGEPFAKNHIFLTLTRLMQRFNIEFDPSSPNPSPEPRLNPGELFKVPEQYKLCFTPR